MGLWQVRLEEAIAGGTDFAFEMTLGGKTITALLAGAADTHEWRTRHP